MEFLTIYCFVFLLKMKPWGSFQVNEATNVVFMILGGCFISEIVLNLSFRRVKKILVKSDSMFTLACEQVLHVRVSQSKRWTINFHQWKNIVRPIKGRERWFPTEWNFIVLDADWLLLIRNDYYAQPYQWINLYTHIIKSYIRLDKGRTRSAFSMLVEIAICLLIVYRMATFWQTKMQDGIN